MRILVVSLVCTAFAVLSQAKTIHVPGDYRKIQEAINAAADGDLVLVATGRYLENIDFMGKDIVLRSTGGCEFTILDGKQAGPVVTFVNYESPAAEICGFTITNGYNPKLYGGGIYCDNNSSPTIRNNRITGNSAYTGGGIFIGLGNNLIENNVVENNTATAWGGGIQIEAQIHAILRNNVVTHNKARLIGGGIDIGGFPWSSIDIINNNISFNWSDQGGGGLVCGGPVNPNSRVVGNIISNNGSKYGTGGVVSINHVIVITDNLIANNWSYLDCGGLGMKMGLDDPESYISNNIICGNHSEVGDGGGVSLSAANHYFINNTVTGNYAGNRGGGMIIGFAKVIARNSIIWGNRAGNEGDDIFYTWNYPDIQYSDIGGGWPGPGNIDADPRFVDSEHGDYHLQHTSPCIDSGTTDARLPPSDFEGDSRIAGPCVDMGADEFATHLYFIGRPSPGASLSLKIIGAPGAAPVALFASEGLLDPPLNTSFGPWFLELPVFGPFLLPPVPGNGVLELCGILPPDIPGPYILEFQAFVTDTLTNLCPLHVE